VNHEREEISVTEHVVFPPSRDLRERVALLTAPPAAYSTGFEDDWNTPVVRGGWKGHPKMVDCGVFTHLFIDPDRIAITWIAHAQGLTKTGKRFSRMQNRGRVTFRFEGGLRVFSSGIAGRKRQVRDITAGQSGAWLSEVNSDKALTPYLLDRYPGDFTFPQRPARFTDFIGPNSLLWQRIAYPILRDAPHWDAMPGLPRGLRQRNVQDFTRAEFGNSRYRKDLVKAIAGAPNLRGVWLAKQLQTTFPIDWLIPLAASGYGRDMEEHRHLRAFMRWLPGHSARRLLLDLPGSTDEVMTLTSARNPWTIPDTLRSWHRILQAKPDYTLGDYRITNWRDMHDHLAREFDKIGREDRQIEASKVAKKLDGKSLNGLTLVHPKSTHELIDWGKNMHNCIGGYDRHATAGKSVLFAVMQGDQMIGNMELDPKGSIRQLVGDYNRALPDPLRDTVYELVGKPVPRTAYDPIEDNWL
jgi:hypothetical protein